MCSWQVDIGNIGCLNPPTAPPSPPDSLLMNACRAGGRREEAGTKGERSCEEMVGVCGWGGGLMSSEVWQCAGSEGTGLAAYRLQTRGCGRIDQGGGGLTGEGRDPDQSSLRTAIFPLLGDYFPLSPWSECSCCSSVGFDGRGEAEAACTCLRRSWLQTNAEHQLTAGNL